MKKILYLGNKLEKHGFSPTSIDTLPALLKEEGYRVTAVSSVKNRPLRLLHMLASVVIKRKADMVLIDTYSTSNFWYAILSAKLCKLFKTPYIFILHGGNLEKRFHASSEKILKIFRNARANVVPSYFLKEKLEKFQFRNMVFIPNSIDLSIYNFNERRALRPRILWVRALHKVYNPEMAILVLEKLLETYPNAELCMVGPQKDGSLKKLEEVVERKKLPVIFKGKLEKMEWIKLSKKYDIFLNTTSIDNTPVSVIEGMALGLPVVSTKVGGIPYLISDEENGILVPPNNPDEMVSAIQRLLTNPQLAEKLSINARKEAEKFDWNKVKYKWLELLG
ncbi:glycosyltransferase family 4 protein [Gramella sp. MAR_2010_147]|uniref:glycosyltransferase family 4 protein n=1 Tax=Gramella sp. MAR_2010_147 TaxID=1250205 RepID=UPI00087ABC86|nr:glycosyltransferase family 4 protein [Gramella sp. MAR_2010_147]SDS00729.1 Glycosyltransferase involved in cell wall bisynthesis [Gramella sp. MAR_2010_147]